ncbi:MAG: heavy metal transporter [Phototrophicales bacterium]|nr:MAG: heavy metal transporter [Phototrophicales bacterium]
MQTKTVTIPAISCGHCVMTIEREVGALPGVKSVKADEHTRKVVVEWDEPATWDAIEELLVEIDYAPQE